MKLSISTATDIVFNDMRSIAQENGFELYKKTLPKGLRRGVVVKVTDITFDDNQQAIVFLLAYMPDVRSGGNYEQSPALDEFSNYIAEKYTEIQPELTSRRYELLGQSFGVGEDETTHYLSNRYLLTHNTE